MNDEIANQQRVQPDTKLQGTNYVDSNNITKENQQLKGELRLQEYQYSSLFNEMHEGLLYLSPKGKIIAVNKAFERITGNSASEYVGKTAISIIKKFLSIKDIPKVISILKKSLSGTPVDMFELEWNSKTFEVSSPTKIDKQVGSIVSVRDITKRKQANLALKKSNSRNKALLKAMPEMMFILSRDGTFLDFKAEVSEELAISPKDIIGKNLSDIGLADNTLKSILKDIVNTLKIECMHKIEYDLKTPTGNNHYEARMVPFGKDTILATVRNVTEKKQATEALIESEEKYRQLVENVNDAIMISQNDKFIFFNKQFCKMLGYSYDELSGKDYRDIYSEEGLKILNARHALRESGAHVPNRYETIFKRKDGSLVDFEANVSIINYKGLKATFAVLRDITDIMLYREKIQKQQIDLENLNILLSEKNIALREIISQLEQEKSKIEKSVQENANKILIPTLVNLKKHGQSYETKYLEMIEKGLKELVSSFGENISNKMFNLTSREIEICNLIKNGFTSKEIGQHLNISYLTVQTQRRNIRNKLDIIRKDINLQSYLKSL